MAEVQAVKDLDTVKLISYLLKRTYGQQLATEWLCFYNNERPNRAIGGIPAKQLLIAV